MKPSTGARSKPTERAVPSSIRHKDLCLSFVCNACATPLDSEMGWTGMGWTVKTKIIEFFLQCCEKKKVFKTFRSFEKKHDFLGFLKKKIVLFLFTFFFIVRILLGFCMICFKFVFHVF